MPPRPLAPLLLSVALVVWAAALAALTWDRGPDPWVDFGRELYVPWRMTEGEVLYRDLAWFNGPLSPWWNAAWMKLCGVSFDTLQWVNLTLVLLGAALLYRLVRAATGAFAACVALFVYFPLFVFSQQRTVGNYTHLAPYSHCIVHGYLLALAALAALARARTSGRARWCAVAGVALGGVFLTKGEVFLAAAGASALALTSVAQSAAQHTRRRATARAILAAAAGFAAPLALAWLALRATLPPGERLPALLGTWFHALNPELSRSSYYAEMRGTDAPWANVQVMLRVAGGVGLFLLASALAARGAALAFGRREATRVVRCLELATLAALGFALVYVILLRFPLELILRPLPLGLVVVASLAWRDRRAVDAATRARGHAALVLAVFSGLLTLKMGLKPSVRDYGFVLAAPGTALCVATLVHGLPRALGAGLDRGRAPLIGALVALSLAHVHATLGMLGRRTIEVRSGGDRIFVEPRRGALLPAILAELDRVVPEDGTLLVLPEGVMVNYWLRRRTPIPVLNFMPPELLMFGERRILADLAAHPPDAVLIAHKETLEYGVRFFGHGYGDALLRWVHDHYSETARFGAVPLTSRDWGAQLLLPK